MPNRGKTLALKNRFPAGQMARPDGTPFTSGGSTGPAGPTGPTGPAGADGADGATGATGPAATVVIATPASVAITNGTPTGAVADVQTMLDGNVYNVVEAAATPGFDPEFTFSGVAFIPTHVVLRVYYDGTAQHDVHLELWNYDTSAYDEVHQVPEDLDYQVLQIAVPDFTNYISAGAVKVRLYHASAGNPAHTLDVDYVALFGYGAAGAAGPQGPKGDKGDTGASGGFALTAHVQDLGVGHQSGTFDITGLAGLTIGKLVTVQHTAAAVSSKGNARDEYSFSPVFATGYVVAADTIRVLWWAPGIVVGDVAFAWAVST